MDWFAGEIVHCFCCCGGNFCPLWTRNMRAMAAGCGDRALRTKQREKRWLKHLQPSCAVKTILRSPRGQFWIRRGRQDSFDHQSPAALHQEVLNLPRTRVLLRKVTGEVEQIADMEKDGRFRESNPGPLAPRARIMPLDQTANMVQAAPSLLPQ